MGPQGILLSGGGEMLGYYWVECGWERLMGMGSMCGLVAGRQRCWAGKGLLLTTWVVEEAG